MISAFYYVVYCAQKFQSAWLMPWYRQSTFARYRNRNAWKKYGINYLLLNNELLPKYYLIIVWFWNSRTTQLGGFSHYRNQVLAQIGSLICLLSGGLIFFCHMGLSMGNLASPQTSNLTEREWPRRKPWYDFMTYSLWVTRNHLCFNVFIRSKFLSSTHT